MSKHHSEQGDEAGCFLSQKIEFTSTCCPCSWEPTCSRLHENPPSGRDLESLESIRMVHDAAGGQAWHVLLLKRWLLASFGYSTSRLEPPSSVSHFQISGSYPTVKIPSNLPTTHYILTHEITSSQRLYIADIEYAGHLNS